MIRDGYTPSGAELAALAEITPEDIARTMERVRQDAPSLRPAFDAVLIPESEDDFGPIPDE